MAAGWPIKPMNDLILWVVALLMGSVGAFVIHLTSKAKTHFDRALALFLLAMMFSMSLGLLLFELLPPFIGLEVALFLGMWIMVIGIAWLLKVLALGEEDSGRFLPTNLFNGIIVAGAILTEAMLGLSLGVISGDFSHLIREPLVSALPGLIGSSWFIFPMAAEMALTAFFLRDRIPGEFLALLFAQSGLMFLAPPAFPGSETTLATFVGSALMIVTITFVMEYLYRHRQMEPVVSSYILLLMGVYGVMMSGLFIWFTYGSLLLFSISILLEMGLFFEVVVSPARFKEPRGEPWQLHADWAFGVLAMIFVSELFMGAVLDIVMEPQVYAGSFPTLPLSGPAATVLSNALSNGFWFIAEVCGSTWFLLMMGFEMGALVVVKMRETKNLENRIRLGLMIASYGAFVLFFPSFYYSEIVTNQAYQGINVPVLGWSMGLGSAPIVPSLFLVIFLTYAITGVLTFLFGRRVICSVFCSAPLMYQGSTIDAMKSFNNTSTVARKYIGSRFSNLYTATSGLVMGSLVVASFISYFDYTGALNITVYGVDPTVFLFSLYFSVLWYLMFVTIPYTGNYNCVTMGWCYTGTVAQAFQKLGPYKLKVRERDTCRTCKTLDCTKACPVGLLNMAGYFRTQGEFKSSKCCGVGNCVTACPYGNLYIHDVRHTVRDWVSSRRGRGSPVESPGPSPDRLPPVSQGRPVSLRSLDR